MSPAPLTKPPFPYNEITGAAEMRNQFRTFLKSKVLAAFFRQDAKQEPMKPGWQPEFPPILREVAQNSHSRIMNSPNFMEFYQETRYQEDKHYCFLLTLRAMQFDLRGDSDFRACEESFKLSNHELGRLLFEM